MGIVGWLDGLFRGVSSRKMLANSNSTENKAQKIQSNNLPRGDVTPKPI